MKNIHDRVRPLGGKIIIVALDEFFKPGVYEEINQHESVSIIDYVISRKSLYESESLFDRSSLQAFLL